MGWLFAVALGLHRQDRRVVWLSLLPIAAGHALSVAVAVGLLSRRAPSLHGQRSCASARGSLLIGWAPTTGASAIAIACASACRRGCWASASGRS